MSKNETEVDEVCEKFGVFVAQWVSEFAHWRGRGHLRTHVRNLGVATMRFAEKIDELTAEREGEKSLPSYEMNWGQIFGFLRKK